MELKFLQKSTNLLPIRFYWLVFIFLIIVFFLILKIVPWGHIVYSRNYANPLRVGQGFIYNFTPQDRVIETRGKLPKMVGDPLYFSVFTPRTFSQAKLKLYYRRHLDEKTPVIEAGVLADGVVWRYDLKPIENRLIDNLKSSWQVLSSSPLIMQQEAYYDNNSEFLQDLEKGSLRECEEDNILSCLATYNYQLNLEPRFSFKSADKPFVLDMPLRGAHTVFLYPESGKLSFVVEFVDLNLDKESDPISLILSQNGKIIERRDLLDENKEAISGREEIKNLDLTFNSLPIGLYKLEIKVSDDVVIKNIKSSTNRLVFVYKLWPVSWGKDINVFTDVNYLQLKALGPASCQDFYFDKEYFSLSLPYVKQEFSLNSTSSSIRKIELTRDDVIIENGSVFGFSPDTFFNPLIKKIDGYYETNRTINYIMADYTSPQIVSGDLLVNEVEFDLMGVYRQDSKYNFVISVPGIEKNFNNYLEIEKIEIGFSGRTLWQKLFNL